MVYYFATRMRQSQKYRVIYMPNCELWIRDKSCLIKALQIAFPDDLIPFPSVDSQKFSEEVLDFLRKAEKRGKEKGFQIIFILDQINAIFALYGNKPPQPFSDVASWLDVLRTGLLIASASANNEGEVYSPYNVVQSFEQLGPDFFGVDRFGFSDTEYQTWKEQKRLTLQPDLDQQIFYVTGYIPLYLDELFKNLSTDPNSWKAAVQQKRAELKSVILAAHRGFIEKNKDHAFGTSLAILCAAVKMSHTDPLFFDKKFLYMTIYKGMYRYHALTPLILDTLTAHYTK